MEYEIHFRKNAQKKHLKNKKQNGTVQLFEINTNLEYVTCQWVLGS